MSNPVRAAALAAITAALLLPAGASLADDGIDRDRAPEIGKPCNPARDTEFEYTSDGSAVQCVDHRWAAVEGEPTPEPSPTEEPAPEPEPSAPEPTEPTEPDDDPQAAPRPGEECDEEGARLPYEGEDGTAEIVCVSDGGGEGGLVWSASGPPSLDEDDAPAPSGDAPDQACDADTEGETRDGHTCVCIDGGDSYSWYVGTWIQVNNTWYLSYDGYYWTYRDGVWVRAAADEAEKVHDDIATTEDQGSGDAETAVEVGDAREASEVGALPTTGVALGALVAGASAALALGAGVLYMTRRRAASAPDDGDNTE